MGKGSVRRPCKVDQKTFASNWERIFEQTSEQQEGSESEVSGEVIENECAEDLEDPVPEAATQEGTRTGDDA